MKTLLALVALAHAAIATSGCSGNQFMASSADAGPIISEDQACGDRAHQNCLKIATCSAEVLTTTYGSETACETRLKLNCLNTLAAASNGNNASSAEACAQAFPAWACNDYFDLRPPAACAQSKGGLSNGQTCGVPGQCQSGFCAIDPGSACGTCAPVPQAGDSCAALTSCGQLLTCFAATKTCVAFAAAGGSCGSGQPCGAAFVRRRDERNDLRPAPSAELAWLRSMTPAPPAIRS